MTKEIKKDFKNMYKYVMSLKDNPIEFPEFLGFTGPYKHFL